MLTGIHIGNYGRDINGSLTDLLIEVFEIESLRRLRLSSLEIKHIDKKLLEVLKANQEKFCDHFHFPLQSGSSRILSLMKRDYTPQNFKKKLSLVREYFPDANIGTDIITGFPSETDDEFEHTIKFLETSDINYAHIFPYSKRPNTQAVLLQNHISPAIQKKRAEILRNLNKKLVTMYKEKFIGIKMEVLWENDTDSSGRRIGKTRNYLIAIHPSSLPEPGTISEIIFCHAP